MDTNTKHMEKIVGVTLNGVLMYTGNAEDGYDAFFPEIYGGKDAPSDPEVDLCLGSSALSDAYHYYGFSPCIFDN